MKFIKPFYGVKAGDIYPTRFQVGDDCPPELEAAAIELGAVEKESNGTRTTRTSAKPRKG